MQKTVFKSEVVDTTTGEVIKEFRVIKKTLPNKEMFIQTYIQDLGVLLKCTKGQIDLLICIINNQFVEFDTNEVLITPARKQVLSECSNIKVMSINNLLVTLKKKNILVFDESKRMYLNPKLFFFGSELAREKMFELRINYTINE